MEHAAPNTSPLTCPFCEASKLKDFGRNSARCYACGGILGGDFLELLRGISVLPDTIGRHACECGHPEMRLLPDGVYRCPACGAEVLPLSASNVSWMNPPRSEAYRQGWLDGRFGDGELLAESRLLARWDTARDRLDFYRGHRAGSEARVSGNRLLEAS
jgi:ribosomal protein L37AE/L43A